MLSPRKKKNMLYAAIIGAVVGTALFAMLYTINNSVGYLVFIPLTSAMACASQYVKFEDPEE